MIRLIPATFNWFPSYRLTVFTAVFQTLLPSPFLPDDAALVLEKCLKSAGRSSAHVFCGSIVASEKFIEECIKLFETLMQEKAEKVRKIHRV